MFEIQNPSPAKKSISRRSMSLILIKWPLAIGSFQFFKPKSVKRRVVVNFEQVVSHENLSALSATFMNVSKYDELLESFQFSKKMGQPVVFYHGRQLIIETSFRSERSLKEWEQAILENNIFKNPSQIRASSLIEEVRGDIVDDMYFQIA